MHESPQKLGLVSVFWSCAEYRTSVDFFFRFNFILKFGMVKLRTEGVGINCVGFKGLSVKGVGCKVRSWRVGGAEWGLDWWESQGTS